jgi:ubiquitin carboxyl-terminal hydrolase 5/13
MNIRQTRKDLQVERSPLKKLTVSSGEEWEAQIFFKCLICEFPLNPDPQVQSLMDSLLQTNSAMFQSSVNQWEQEIFPCEHTLTLVQSSSLVAEKSLAKCGSCDLNSNLWLCMTCGKLGCGRKNFDGSGGNGHALHHFQMTQHPLVCKMGTITPEGTASIHCYTCDEEVQDNDLQTHMLTFGIQIQKLVKTEKTITELELEANINLTLSKAVEEGRVLTPRYGPMFTGMENLGNSCYLNSIMQTILAIPEWMSRFNDENLLKSNDPAGSFHCQMAKLAIGLASGKYSSQKWTEPIETEPGVFSQPQEYQDGVRPMMFKALVGKGHSEFSSAKQQDAFEFFQHFLSLTEKSEKITGTSEKCPNFVFEFVLRSKVKCLTCNKVRFTDLKQNSISSLVTIDPKEDGPEAIFPWEKLLNNFKSPEYVEFQCPSCNTKTTASKSYSFLTFPKVLVLLVNRFVYNDWVPKKLECGVNVPVEPFSLQGFKFQDLAEEVLPEEAEKEPPVNQFFLSQLIDMGITETQAKNALLRTGNAGVEIAASWVFENLDNPEINRPVSASKTEDPAVSMICEMGFTNAQAKYALKKCDGNAERAIDYLFNHPDEMQLDEKKAGVESDQACFQLFSVVTHLGASVHSGHYVAHLRKGEEWVLFNDGKVAATSEPPLMKGYIYFFRLID